MSGQYRLNSIYLNGVILTIEKKIRVNFLNLKE